MRIRFAARILVLAAVAVGVAGVAGGVARATTGPALYYTIHVTITDTKIKLSRQDLPRTYSARFDIRNLGKKTHTFTLGPRLNGKVTVVSRTVKPKAHAVAYFVQNDERGVLRFYSLIPADAKNKGLQGVFTID
jgi:hypothetical protein